MPPFRNGLILLCLVRISANCTSSQDKPAYPSEREIQSLLTRAEHAWQQFRPLIDQANKLSAKNNAAAAQEDLLITYSLDVAIPMLRHRPPNFNGPGGFQLFEWLSDAGRDAALCANSASTQARLAMAAGKTELMNEFDLLGQNCSNASTSLHTVSKEAGTLYRK